MKGGVVYLKQQLFKLEFILGSGAHYVFKPVFFRTFSHRVFFSNESCVSTELVFLDLGLGAGVVSGKPRLAWGTLGNTCRTQALAV